jgi:hypothetical protein
MRQGATVFALRQGIRPNGRIVPGRRISERLDDSYSPFISWQALPKHAIGQYFWSHFNTDNSQRYGGDVVLAVEANRSSHESGPEIISEFFWRLTLNFPRPGLYLKHDYPEQSQASLRPSQIRIRHVNHGIFRPGQSNTQSCLLPVLLLNRCRKKEGGS